ncbi:MAG: hypothetical protein J3R72DRAFT_494566 [Linnemannia gamsii]|nr:MAG: hypothetical protein J3R72DRAFT_494566 [Linnemannia gamsii]
MSDTESEAKKREGSPTTVQAPPGQRPRPNQPRPASLQQHSQQPEQTPVGQEVVQQETPLGGVQTTPTVQQQTGGQPPIAQPPGTQTTTTAPPSTPPPAAQPSSTHTSTTVPTPTVQPSGAAGVTPGPTGQTQQPLSATSPAASGPTAKTHQQLQSAKSTSSTAFGTQTQERPLPSTQLSVGSKNLMSSSQAILSAATAKRRRTEKGLADLMGGIGSHFPSIQGSDLISASQALNVVKSQMQPPISPAAMKAQMREKKKKEEAKRKEEEKKEEA